MNTKKCPDMIAIMNSFKIPWGDVNLGIYIFILHIYITYMSKRIQVNTPLGGSPCTPYMHKHLKRSRRRRTSRNSTEIEEYLAEFRY